MIHHIANALSKAFSAGFISDLAFLSQEDFKKPRKFFENSSRDERSDFMKSAL